MISCELIKYLVLRYKNNFIFLHLERGEF